MDAPIVAFVGPNGQGKTNLLEAVGVLGTLRSFRTTRPAEMVAWGRTGGIVEGVGASGEMLRTWRWSFEDGVRKLQRDGKGADPPSWIASLRATHFVPSDTLLLRGEPALRRALLDRAVLTVEPAYLGPVQELRRLLQQKSALLRSGRSAAHHLDVVDSRLVEVGVKVVAARERVAADMSSLFHRFYKEAGADEPVTVRYRSFLGPAEGLAARFTARLDDAREREWELGRPLIGPHRDDLDFGLAGRPARQFASQGQVRSMVLAWKLAELEAARRGGETPMFLLDDLGSELDPERSQKLVTLLGTLGAQVFLTTTDTRYLPAGLDLRQIRVQDGEVH